MKSRSAIFICCIKEGFLGLLFVPRLNDHYVKSARGMTETAHTALQTSISYWKSFSLGSASRGSITRQAGCRPREERPEMRADASLYSTAPTMVTQAQHSHLPHLALLPSARRHHRYRAQELEHQEETT